MVITHSLTDTDWYISIAGIDDVKIKTVEDTLKKLRTLTGDVLFQLFNADMVACSRHLYYAAVNAVKAMEVGAAVSKSLDVETLLYASCQDQISKAIKFMGISSNTSRVAVLVFAHDETEAVSKANLISEYLGVMDDEVLSVNKIKYKILKKTFGISEKAIDTLGMDPYDGLASLIIEKGALLPLQR